MPTPTLPPAPPLSAVAHETLAPGVHRVADPVVNWYLVEDDEGVTAVDAGFPADWRHLLAALDALGRRDELRAVVVTHAHVDHLGFADRARRELGAHVFVPEADADLARDPLRAAASQRSPLRYLGHSATRRLFLTALLMGGPRGKLLGEFATYAPDEELPVPGRPRVVATPGHTAGHSSLLLADRGVLLTGDALVTRDPYTGRTGPRLVARAATLDAEVALRSLDAIAATGAELLLPGHGEPWRDGAARAAERAREAGAA